MIFILHRLKEQGVDSVRYVGRTAVWRAEPRNQMLAALKVLVEVEDGLVDEVQRRIKRTLQSTKAKRVVIFGSVARGIEGPGSDLDLFVQVPTDGDKERLQRPLLRLHDDLAARFGCSLSPIVLSRKEAEDASKGGLIETIHATGKVVLDRGN